MNLNYEASIESSTVQKFLPSLDSEGYRKLLAINRAQKQLTLPRTAEDIAFKLLELTWDLHHHEKHADIWRRRFRTAKAHPLKVILERVLAKTRSQPVPESLIDVFVDPNGNSSRPHSIDSVSDLPWDSLPDLGDEDWEYLYYALVCKLRELYVDMQARYSCSFIGIQHVLHDRGQDGDSPGEPFKVESMRDYIISYWYLLHDDTFTSELNSAIKTRKIGLLKGSSLAPSFTNDPYKPFQLPASHFRPTTLLMQNTVHGLKSIGPDNMEEIMNTVCHKYGLDGYVTPVLSPFLKTRDGHLSEGQLNLKLEDQDIFESPLAARARTALKAPPHAQAIQQSPGPVGGYILQPRSFESPAQAAAQVPYSSQVIRQSHPKTPQRSNANRRDDVQSMHVDIHGNPIAPCVCKIGCVCKPICDDYAVPCICQLNGNTPKIPTRRRPPIAHLSPSRNSRAPPSSRSPTIPENINEDESTTPTQKALPPVFFKIPSPSSNLAPSSSAPDLQIAIHGNLVRSPTAATLRTNLRSNMDRSPSPKHKKTVSFDESVPYQDCPPHAVQPPPPPSKDYATEYTQLLPDYPANSPTAHHTRSVPSNQSIHPADILAACRTKKYAEPSSPRASMRIPFTDNGYYDSSPPHQFPEPPSPPPNHALPTPPRPPPPNHPLPSPPRPRSPQAHSPPASPTRSSPQRPGQPRHVSYVRAGGNMKFEDRELIDPPFAPPPIAPRAFSMSRDEFLARVNAAQAETDRTSQGSEGQGPTIQRSETGESEKMERKRESGSPKKREKLKKRVSDLFAWRKSVGEERDD
ncbi:hypothetical protein BT63DRAFT_451410 [Microthyrium microscopicum]|uniref:Uncharacterized protein n=1 Tax=Microthyrium microscopicum TaxID=703497 RepID=A0A6A6UPP9_9PEZI|nr:hypothetical protein BT63DRAFT_451410 [Microthyrium microscopicum]